MFYLVHHVHQWQWQDWLDLHLMTFHLHSETIWSYWNDFRHLCGTGWTGMLVLSLTGIPSVAQLEGC